MGGIASMSKESAPSYWLDLVVVILLVGSSAAEVYTIRMFLQAIAVASWPTADGVVLHSELVTKFYGHIIEYEANIRYKYKAGGQEYESKSIRTRGVATKHRDDAEEAVTKYSVGTRVQ